MSFKDLVSTISSNNDIPAGTVRKVAKALVESIKASVESGEDLKLPGLKIKTKVIPAREATETFKARPEMKRTVVKLYQANDRDAD
uniref:HU family DNA-binding protein n=1 Tax=Synechococcus sp. UW106 TaxID=368495 RepID=UPI00148266B3|nr:HU family DNA-binding protein [Synechococcus sp. UW106]